MSSSLDSQLAWMASRACGFGAFVTFSAVVMLGLLTASGLLRRAGSRRTTDLAAWHRVLALVGWPLIAAHGLLLLADPWLHPTVTQVAWPFGMHLHKACWAGFGAVTVVALALATATPWLQRRLRAVPWPAVHRIASVIAYAAMSVHVIGAGSDTGRGLVRFGVIQVLALTGLIAALRVVAPRLPPRAARPR
jgi:predicted ferric reductase